MSYRMLKFCEAEFMGRPAATPHIDCYGEPRPQEPSDRRSVRPVHCVPNPDIAYSFEALFDSTNARLGLPPSPPCYRNPARNCILVFAVPTWWKGAGSPRLGLQSNFLSQHRCVVLVTTLVHDLKLAS